MNAAEHQLTQEPITLLVNWMKKDEMPHSPEVNNRTLGGSMKTKGELTFQSNDWNGYLVYSAWVYILARIPRLLVALVTIDASAGVLFPTSAELIFELLIKFHVFIIC